MVGVRAPELTGTNRAAQLVRWIPRKLLGEGSPFPWEQTLVNFVAVIVGIYAGLATGLLANFIILFQLFFFRTGDLLRAFSGRDYAWAGVFTSELAAAPWHFEYLALAVAAIGAARALSPFSETTLLRQLPLLQKRRLRFVAYVLGFGLVLYYPLLALATFTRSFSEVHGGLLATLGHAPRILWLVIPVLGGLGVGFLVEYVAPESGGHGVTEVIEAISTGGQRIPGRVAILKSLLAGLTIGSGGSCGREGPVVHMGASVGSELAGRLGLSRENVSLLMASGAAAGIAASFNAPIAGAMFALEIVLGDFGVRSFSPIVLAAVTATATARSLLGAGGEIARLTYSLKTPGEIVAYAVLGGLCGLGGIAYYRTLHWAEEVFVGKASPGLALARLPRWLRPAMGGLGVGLLGLLIPQVLGNGYETMNSALFEQMGFGMLVLVFGAKLLATGCTLGSGAPGGSFFPAVFLGAMLGGAFGSVIHGLLPAWTAGSGAYAAVGMGALAAGATLAPLTGILMIFELTGNYQAVLPLMVACGLSAAMVHWALGGSIYTLHLKSKGIHRSLEPKHLLKAIAVSDAMTRDVQTIPEGLRFDQILELLGRSSHSAFPVVQADGRLIGLFSVAEARPFLYNRELGDLVVARDLCRLHAPTLVENDDLETALQRLVTGPTEQIPVVARDDPDRLMGILTRRDILQAYQRALGVAGGE